MKKVIKKLTSRDAVIGIGRLATDDELKEYLQRERKDEFKPLSKIRGEIAIHLSKRNQSRKAS